MERLPPVANLVISNVPGPQVPLYLSGAKMATFYPVSIIVHGIALNVTVQTYCGAIYFGVIACKKAVPNLHKLTDAIGSAFDELAALAEAHEALARERAVEAAATETQKKSASQKNAVTAQQTSRASSRNRAKAA
jgi:hypothetical protein